MLPSRPLATYLAWTRDRMAIIGASIGADGAVNACGEGCLGAFSLSPGNYLALSYPDVMSDLPLVFPMFSDTCLPKQIFTRQHV